MKKFFATLAAITAALTLSLAFAACGDGKVEVTNVTLNKTEISLEIGGEETLTATVTPENATDKTVSWKSSDEAVATVQNGTVKAIKDGTATVTAKVGDKTAECNVTVTKPAPVELTKEQIKKAFDNTINAENVTFSLYPADNTIFIDSTNKKMYMNTSDSYTVIAEGDGEDFIIKEYRVPDPDESPDYNFTNFVTTECEQFTGKKITSFAELTASYLSKVTNLHILKEMEFTYDTEENSYCTEVTQGVKCFVYFEDLGDNARVSRYVIPYSEDMKTEFRFYDYGTTVAPAPTTNHVLVYSSK